MPGLPLPPGLAKIRKPCQGKAIAAMDITPASLLDHLRNPADQAAWKRFVQIYTPLMYHWAHRIRLQDQDAADLVQDVFTVLVQKLPEFRYDRQRSFRAWLKTVLLNKWREQQ